jgi:prepilin-type processing-associated H-X9-DG protein
LAVVSIVALMVCLLGSGLREVQKAAKSVRCLSSLRQIGAAGAAYPQEWSGRHCPMISWIDAAHWFRNPSFKSETQGWAQFLAVYFDDGNAGKYSASKLNVRDYRGTVFKGCPVSAPRLAPFTYNGSNVSWQFGYGMNDRKTLVSGVTQDGYDDLWTFRAAPYSGLGSGGWRIFRVLQVTYPSQRVWFGDSQTDDLWCETTGPRAYGTNRTYTHWQVISWKDLRFTDHLSSGDPLRHGGRANYVFFDGHAGSLSATDYGLAMTTPNLR